MPMVPQPGGRTLGGSRRHHNNESDYEEIGTPPNRQSTPASNGEGSLFNQAAPALTCDLCGTATAMVRCRLCSDQVFCLACDDMYHKHPRRSTHMRKAIDESARPPLPPKADGPVAPPRKTTRKGSITDSPMTQRNVFSAQSSGQPLSKSSTLPRKLGSAMVGRPLPPPPPAAESLASIGSRPQALGSSANEGNRIHRSFSLSQAPPLLPAKNLGRSSNSPMDPKGSIPSRFDPTSSASGLERKFSTASQPPMHLSYPPKPLGLMQHLQPQGGPGSPQGTPDNLAMVQNAVSSSTSAGPQRLPSGLIGYPQLPRLPPYGSQFVQNPAQQELPASAFMGFPGMQAGYPSQPNLPTTVSATVNDWTGVNPYHEEVQFPPQPPSLQGSVSGKASVRMGKNLPAHYRNRLSKLNKSSSLHDIAHGLDGVGRFQENGTQEPNWLSTQSTMNQPTMTMMELLQRQQQQQQQHSRNFWRSGSSRSLHQQEAMAVNPRGGATDLMWGANPQQHLQHQHQQPTVQPGSFMANGLNPMVMFDRYPFLGAPAGLTGNPMLHRSMHELSSMQPQRRMPMGSDPITIMDNFRPSSPCNSQKSSRSKKSNRSSVHGRRRRQPDQQRAAEFESNPGKGSSSSSSRNRRQPETVATSGNGARKRSSSVSGPRPQAVRHSLDNVVRNSGRVSSSSSSVAKKGGPSSRDARSGGRSRGRSSSNCPDSDDSVGSSEDEDFEEDEDDEDELSRGMSAGGEDDEDEDDDFYTGESDDNDFVSLSSGSNSRKAPKRSWTCEHCTYVNNPGVTVCCICCKTSRQSRGEPGSSPDAFQARQQTSSGGGQANGNWKAKRFSSDEDIDDDDEEDDNRRRRGSATKQPDKAKKAPPGTGTGSGGAKAGPGSSAKRKLKMRQQQKTPLPRMPPETVEETQKKLMDELEQDALDTYYSLRVDNLKRLSRPDNKADNDGGDGRTSRKAGSSSNHCYESSTTSETSSVNNADIVGNRNPLRKPNLDAPAPAKGILKKSNSNPQLTKLEQEQLSTFSMVTKTLSKHLGSNKGGPVGKVVDIKKYLAKAHQAVPPSLPANATATPLLLAQMGSAGLNSGDIWSNERANWLRAQMSKGAEDDDVRSTRANVGEDVLHDNEEEDSSSRISDVEINAGGRRRLYRSLSGHSLGDLGLDAQQDRSQHKQQSQRRSSEAGKRNFRSKRFSRNLERDPAIRRSHSLHNERDSAGRGAGGGDDDVDDWLDVQSGTFRMDKAHSESSGGEDGGPHHPVHFTAKVETNSRGPGGIGSYLARREFGGSNEGTANGGRPADGHQDSGYVSHGSVGGGGGAYPKLKLPSQAPIESFTLSMDRGFLGRFPGSDRDPGLFRSMDDLSVQKATGLELVRLLREAEQSGYTAEDVQVSLNHCRDTNPVQWLKENWENMIETVMTLASNVGHEAAENTIGTLSQPEARTALRKHKGNIWAAVTECVEQRQSKYEELCSKGNFTREDVVTVLTAHQGNTEAAFQELNKAQLKPFLMRIWGQSEMGEVESGPEKLEDSRGKDGAEVKLLGKPTSDVSTSIRLTLPVSSGPNSSTAGGNMVQSVTSAGIGNAEVEGLEGDEINVVAEVGDQPPIEHDTELYANKFQFERQVRQLLAEGKIGSYEKGELVIKLKDLEFEEDEALVAADNCSDVYSATKFLHQECELCATRMGVKDVVSMLECDHKCCKECASKHFAITVLDRTINEAVCPFCREPKYLADDEDRASEFFAKLDIFLKALLDQATHDLFQRKLRDRTLMKDPNFKWCYKCSSGFIADPKNKKLVCPDCRAMSCARCLVPWESQHEGVSCEDFARWKDENDPDNQAKGLKQHLEEHGIECPACKFRYTLSRGGCMHFTCIQCKHEFCIGCNRPFKMGVKCGKGPACARMGLHAHHPRNCLFYLRDKDPADLQKLLKKSKVEFNTEAPAGPSLAITCPVQVQRDTPQGLEDAICDEESPKGYAGYCKHHYMDYLAKLVFKHKLDPVSILDQDELEAVVLRAGKALPSRYSVSSRIWTDKLLNYCPVVSAATLFESQTVTVSFERAAGTCQMRKRTCRDHYTEYLCSLIFRHSIEPVSLFELGEIKQVFKRANHFMPAQRPGEYEFQYKKRLSQLITHEIPLDST